MPRLRHKSMRYRFLAIVMVLAAGSLSSCQQSSVSPGLKHMSNRKNQVLLLQTQPGSFLRHAMLHVPR